MKSIFYLKQRTKVALLLFCVMACSILIRFLEDRSVNKMNESYKSLYNDRLVPSILLHEINIISIDKNQTILKELDKEDDLNEKFLKTSIDISNSKIDSIIQVYEKTYLVETEILQLNKLKENISKIQNYEKIIFRFIEAERIESAEALYELEGQTLNLETTNIVTQLMTLHIQVGNDMMKDVDSIVSGTQLYSTLQIALAVIIGLLIMGILFTVKLSRTEGPKDFHLN